MSRGLRRTLSWLLVLALIAAAVIAWQLVPGSGGIEEELRWLLAKDYVPPPHYNRVSTLMMWAEMQQSGRRADILRSLLLDEDARIMGGGLLLLGDAMRLQLPLLTDSRDLAAILIEWLQRATLEQKVAHLQHLVACWDAATSWIDPNARLMPPYGEWERHITREDRAWMVAGTVGNARDRDLCEGWVFRDPDLRGEHVGDWPAADYVIWRLRFLDGLVPTLLITEWRAPPKPVSVTAAVCADEEELLAMLSGPIDQVRWGAGRILAVAGDARGMPAFCEWLAHNPHRTRAADELMTGLYGANWRELCESGSAASQPGAGNGGG